MYAEGFYGADSDEGLRSGEVKPHKQKSLSFCEFCKRLADTLDDIGAQMLAIGMPYDLYWHGEKSALDIYIKSVAYRNKLRNEDFHLMGVYVLLALRDVLQFENPHEIFPREPLKLDDSPTAEQTQEDIEAEVAAMFRNAKKEKRDG